MCWRYSRGTGWLLLCLVVTLPGCYDDDKHRRFAGDPGAAGTDGRIGVDGPPGDPLALPHFFPGSDVAENLVADDLRGLTHGTVKVHDGVQMFWNGSDQSGILLYLAVDGEDGDSGLYAHHLSDTAFTPPVRLSSGTRLSSTGGNIDEFEVIFIETSGDNDEDVAARDGDAIVYWLQDDHQPAGVTTTHAFAAYFDLSVRNDGRTVDTGGNEFLHGFQTTPSRVSLYPERMETLAAGDGNATAFPDLDVGNQILQESGGFEITATVNAATVTIADTDLDGVLEETSATGDFDTGSVSYSATSDAIDLTFNTAPDDGTDITITYQARSRPVSRIAFASDSLACSHEYAGMASNLLPVAARSGQRTTFLHLLFRQNQGDTHRWYSVEFDLDGVDNEIPAQASTGDDEFPDGGLTLTGSSSTAVVVHNGNVLWLGNTAGGDQLMLTQFDDGSSQTTTLSLTVGDDPDLPDPESVYGDDQRLSDLLVFYEGFGGEDSLYLAQVDLSNLDVETEDIDADPGGTASSNDNGNVIAFIGTRIARDGSRLFALWRQDDDDGGNILFCQGVETGVDLDDALTGPEQVPNQVTTGASTFDEYLQSELADGSEDPLSGIQSDLSRFNFTFFQDQGRTDDELFHNGFFIDLSTTPPAGSFAVDGAFTGVEGNVADLEADNDGVVVVLDLGIEDTANLPSAVADEVSTGDPVIYFLAFDANERERMFGWYPALGAGNHLQVSSPDDSPTGDSEFFPVSFMRWGSTPVDYEDSDANGGDFTHIFFREIFLVGDPGDEIDGAPENLRTRYLDKARFQSLLAGISGTPDPDDFADAFVDGHEPPLDAHPVSLSNEMPEMMFFPKERVQGIDNPGDTFGPASTFFTSRDNTAGVYWVASIGGANHHLWYQEFDGESWIRRGADESTGEPGFSWPQLIDNLNPSPLFPDRGNSNFILPAWQDGSHDTFGKAAVFFAKYYDVPAFFRMFVRVHFEESFAELAEATEEEATEETP